MNGQLVVSIFSAADMKTLLVPTDFTHSSNLATDYAAKLAARTQSELYLMNTIQLPSSLDTSPYRNYEVLEDIVHNAEEQFSLLRKKYSDLGISISSILKPSSQPEELRNHLNLIDPDLIIMGSSRFSRLKEFSSLSGVPIVMLKEPLSFTKKKGLFVCMGKEILNQEMFDEIRGIASYFKSNVTFCQNREFTDVFKESLLKTAEPDHIRFTMMDKKTHVNAKYLNENYNAVLFKINGYPGAETHRSRIFNELLPGLTIPAFLYPVVCRKKLFFSTIGNLTSEIPADNLF